MNVLQYCASLEIASCSIRFETQCLPAFQYLSDLDSFLGDHPYEFKSSPLNLKTPGVRYEDVASYHLNYSESDDQLILGAPWAQVPSSTILTMALWLMCDLVRQRRAEYILHASAVVREGRAIVFCGASEAGKTTMALELCLNHGFELFSNDRVRIACRDNIPTLVWGDHVFNFRFTSLKKYSDPLCHRVFGVDQIGSTPWNVKKQVSPQTLGINVCTDEIPISELVFVRLDDTCKIPIIEKLEHTSLQGYNLDAKVELYKTMSNVIRGNFVPFDGVGRYVPLCIPSFDRMEFVQNRTEFLNALFSKSQLLRIRGSLNDSVNSCLQWFNIN